MSTLERTSLASEGVGHEGMRRRMEKGNFERRKLREESGVGDGVKNFILK